MTQGTPTLVSSFNPNFNLIWKGITPSISVRLGMDPVSLQDTRKISDYLLYCFCDSHNFLCPESNRTQGTPTLVGIFQPNLAEDHSL